MAIEQDLVSRIFSQPSTTLKDTSITDILKAYTQNVNVKKNEINSSLDSLVKLLPYVNNAESMSSITNSYKNLGNKADNYSETKMNYDLVGHALFNREGQIHQYTTKINQAEAMINEVGFLNKASEFQDIGSMVEAIQNPNGKQKYESTMEWVADEYARIDAMHTVLVEGYKNGLKRGKGIDDANILASVAQYKKRLDTTLEALIGDEVITSDEAQLIISGGRAEFIIQRDASLREIKGGIEEYDNLIKIIDQTLIGVRGGTDKNQALMESVNKIMSDVGVGDDAKAKALKTMEGDGLLLEDEKGLNSFLNDYIAKRDSLLDSHKAWKGRDYEAAYTTSAQIGEEDFSYFASDESGADIIDSDEDGIPDTIDADSAKEEEEKKILDKKFLSFDDAKKLGGQGIIEGYMRGDISEETIKGTLENMDEFDIGLTIPWNPMIPFSFFSLRTEGKAKREILDLKEDESFYPLPFLPIPMRARGAGLAVKEQKVEYVGAVIDEWINMDTDKAGLALNKLLKGEKGYTLMQASNDAIPEGVEKGRPIGARGNTGFRWNKEAKKIRAFILKFKNSDLTLEKFIKTNPSEYRNIARTLKYSKFWRKSHV